MGMRELATPKLVSRRPDRFARSLTRRDQVERGSRGDQATVSCGVEMVSLNSSQGHEGLADKEINIGCQRVDRRGVGTSDSFVFFFRRARVWFTEVGCEDKGGGQAADRRTVLIRVGNGRDMQVCGFCAGR